MKLKCPHCPWSLAVPEKRDSTDLVNHIFVNHWHEIRLKIKKEEQEKLRAETNRELEKEKKRKKKRD